MVKSVSMRCSTTYGQQNNKYKNFKKKQNVQQCISSHTSRVERNFFPVGE